MCSSDLGLTEQANIEVYAVDGTVTATGDMTCKQQVEAKKDAGNWVKLAKSEVALAPGTSTNVDFAVTAPDKADVGEHNACLVIQRKADPAAAKKGGIQLQTRQAIRMAITIPGNIQDIVARLSDNCLEFFRDMNLSKSAGRFNQDRKTHV